jgi:hypothetical protein
MPHMPTKTEQELTAVLESNRIADDRRQSPRVPLMVSAWIWRENTAEPTAVRLLDESEAGVGFIAPMSLKVGERFELALGRTGVRRTSLCVKCCEFISADTFRIGAQS